MLRGGPVPEYVNEAAANRQVHPSNSLIPTSANDIPFVAHATDVAASIGSSVQSTSHYGGNDQYDHGSEGLRTWSKGHSGRR
jgi:hypothetical protein